MSRYASAGGVEEEVGGEGRDAGHTWTGQVGRVLANGAESAHPGLRFAGYAEPFTGRLRSFRLQADPIAAAVNKHLTKSRVALRA
jgi:hypothetical protein